MVRRIAVEYLWLVSVSYGAYGLVMSANASFNGMGTPLPTIVLSAARVIVVFLPLCELPSTGPKVGGEQDPWVVRQRY